MKILVTFAVEQEFAPWRRLRAFRRAAEARFCAYEAQIGETTVLVLLTGLGEGNAREALRVALFGAPQVCISAGLAGGLRAGFRTGDVLAAREVREVRGGSTVSANATLFDAALEIGALPATFVTSPHLVADAEGKRGLGAIADAVEMESYAVLSEASSGGAQCIAVRAICDPVEMNLPYDFSRVLDARGRLKLLPLLGQVAQQPRRIGGLVRLARCSRMAAARLAGFLEAYLERMSGRQFEPAGLEAVEELSAT